MAITVLPIDALLPSYTVDVDLGATVYRFDLAYNTRAECWSIGIGLPDGTVIANGQVIRADWEPFAAIVDERMPAGTIFTVDLEGTGTDPDETDLGTRVLVCYDDGE